MSARYYDPETDEQAWAIWNQAVLDRLVRDEKSEDAQMLIQVCPCCGAGRTLFVHVQKEPALVISSDFTNWCNSCRYKLARKAVRNSTTRTISFLTLTPSQP